MISRMYIREIENKNRELYTISQGLANISYIPKSKPTTLTLREATADDLVKFCKEKYHGTVE